MPRVDHMRLATLLVALVLLFPGRSSAQDAPPIFHGLLDIHPALGRIDKNVGIGKVQIKRWDLVLRNDSNGIFPTREQVLIAIGDSERLVVPPGTIRSSPNGKRFTYRDPKATRGVRSLQLRQYTKGCIGKACYHVSLALVQVDFSALVIGSPVCSPMAIIIGDDDGFSDVALTRPRLVGTTIHVLPACPDPPNNCPCPPGTAGGWPWLN